MSGAAADVGGGPMLVAGRAHPELAAAVAAGLGTRPVDGQGERFPDGELRPTARCVRERDVYLLAPTGPPVNDNLVELMLRLGACRRGGAARCTAVVPYWDMPVRTGVVSKGRPWAVGPAADRLGPLPIRRLLVTDTLPPAEPALPGVTAVSVAGLLSDAIGWLHGGAPVDDLLARS